MSFHAYVFFSNGQCKEAMTRYQEVFGGDLEIMTMADRPDDGQSMPGMEPHHVMHSSLRVGDGLLMASDDPTGDGGPRLGITVSYSAPDTETGRRVFEALAAGGEVQMPYEPTFWSPGFGACVDRWGVPWMVDTLQPGS
jgi:PhnB protein